MCQPAKGQGWAHSAACKPFQIALLRTHIQYTHMLSIFDKAIVPDLNVTAP